MPGRAKGKQTLREASRHAHAYIQSFSGLSGNARNLVVSAMLMWVGIGISGVLFNLYLVALGFNIAFVGLLAAVSTVGQASVSPIMARLLRRWTAQTVMTAATSLAAFATVITAIVTNAVPLLFAVVLQGAAIAAASIPSAPFLMEHSTVEQRTHVFSAYVAATTFGSMAGSLISGLIPAVCGLIPFFPGSAVAQDRLGLLVGALVTALGILPLLRIADARVADGVAGTPVALSAVVDTDQDQARGDVIAMMVASAFIALSLGVIYPLFNVYFATVHHASTATIGVLYAVSGVVCTVAVLLGPIAARLGALRWIVLGRLVTAPLLLVFWTHPGLAIAFTAYICRNIFGQITGVHENTFSMEIVPARLRGAVASWRTFSFNVGWTAGALIAGVVVAKYGFDPVFVASTILTLAGVATWYCRFGRKAARKRFPLHT